MHAFMAAVLLGMTGFDAFNANPQPEPPDCKFAQVKQGVCRSEGHTVVTANVDRQAALLKKPLKHRKSVILASGRKSLTGEEKTAGVIGDGSVDSSIDDSPARTRPCNRCTTAHSVSGLRIKRFREHDGASDRGAPPNRGDPAH